VSSTRDIRSALIPISTTVRKRESKVPAEEAVADTTLVLQVVVCGRSHKRARFERGTPDSHAVTTRSCRALQPRSRPLLSSSLTAPSPLSFCLSSLDSAAASVDFAPYPSSKPSKVNIICSLSLCIAFGCVLPSIHLCLREEEGNDLGYAAIGPQQSDPRTSIAYIPASIENRVNVLWPCLLWSLRIWTDPVWVATLFATHI
jgi:hypothetical protein